MRVKIPADLSATGEARWKDEPIDACIASLVRALQESGIDMRGSCCGHGKDFGRISLQDGRVLVVTDQSYGALHRAIRALWYTIRNRIVWLWRYPPQYLRSIWIKIREQGEALSSEGVNVRFTVREYDFEQLTNALIELEREQGRSTLDVFREYIRGDFAENETIEQWFSLFFLYLGTEEVRRWSCP